MLSQLKQNSASVPVSTTQLEPAKRQCASVIKPTLHLLRNHHQTKPPFPSSDPTSRHQHSPPSSSSAPEELLSSLPLTCRQIFTDTHSITQPPKHLTLCSAPCLTSLLSAANPTQLALITKITIAIDLRIFRPAASSGHLASFRDIWKCIYNTRIVVDRSIHKFYSGPSVERMNADIIAPELDFYPLVIKTGRPFDCKEMVFQRFWCDYSKGEERLAEFMRVLGKNQREMRGLGEGVPRLEGRDRIEGRGRAKASASRQVDSG